MHPLPNFRGWRRTRRTRSNAALFEECTLADNVATATYIIFCPPIDLIRSIIGIFPLHALLFYLLIFIISHLQEDFQFIQGSMVIVVEFHSLVLFEWTPS